MGKDLQNGIPLIVSETSLNENTRYLIFKLNFKLENAVTGRKFYNRPCVNSIRKITRHGKVISSHLFLYIRDNVMDIPRHF